MRLKPLLMVMAAVVLVSVATGLARPAIAFYTRYTLGSTMIAAAGLTSGFMLGRMLTSIASGLASELAPGRQWLIAGAPALASALVVYSIPGLGEPELVVAFMGLWGLLGGLTWPTVQIAVAEHAGSRSTTALSVYFALGTLGISLGNWLFGHLDMGYEDLIRFSALLMLPAAALVGAALRMHPPSPSQGRGLGLVLRRLHSPLVAWVLIASLVLGMLNGLLREYFYIYSHEVYGLTRGGLGSLLAAAGVASFIAGLAVGPAGDRWGIVRVLALVSLVAAMGSLLVGLPHGSVALAGLGFTLSSVGVRASLPLTRNRNLLPGAGGAAVVGLSNASLNLGVMLSPLVAGFLYERAPGYAGLPYVVLGLLLPLLVVWFHVRRDVKVY